MKTRTRVYIVVVIFCVACLSGAWHARRSALRLRATLDDLAAKRTEMWDGIAHANERLAAAESECAGLRAALATPQKSDASNAAIPKPTPSVTTTASITQRLERIDKDPIVQTLRLKARRGDLTRRYGPFFHSLNLSAAQIQQFQDIAMTRSERSSDLYAVAGEQGLAYTDPAITTMQRQLQSEYETAQRELLGDAGYREFQDYERTSTVREIASGFAGAAALEGAPLTMDQVEAMTRALAESSESYRKGSWALPQSVDWEIADARIRPLLTEAQFALFETVEFSTSAGGRFRARLSGAIERAKKADEAQTGTLSQSTPGG